MTEGRLLVDALHIYVFKIESTKAQRLEKRIIDAPWHFYCLVDSAGFIFDKLATANYFSFHPRGPQSCYLFIYWLDRGFICR